MCRNLVYGCDSVIAQLIDVEWGVQDDGGIDIVDSKSEDSCCLADRYLNHLPKLSPLRFYFGFENFFGLQSR